MPHQADVQHWADELQRLLQGAAAARQSEDMARIVDVQQQLRNFCLDSPPFADVLDKQALGAIFDLDLAQSEEAVRSIRVRAAEVQNLAKLIAGIAETAKAQANVLNGTLALQAIEAATSAIVSFKKLRDELDASQPDLAALAGTIDKTLASVQALRNKLEKA